MRYFNKIILILVLSFCNLFPASAGEEWREVTYFKRFDFKMRIIEHNLPIVLDWDKLVGAGELPDKLRPIALSRSPFGHMDYDDWQAYFTSDYLSRMTRERFNKFRKVDIRNYPEWRFRSILYEVDYILDGKEYSLVVNNTGDNKINKFPLDMEKFRKQEGVVAFFMVKEKGKWKGHLFDFDRPHSEVFEFADFDLLNRIIETGFIYNSKKHGDVWPFVPGSELKKDSISANNNVLPANAGEGWNDVTYFQRIDFKMRLVKKEGGKWEGYDLELKKMPYEEMFQSADLELLENIIQIGFVYRSKKHAGVWPFVPCDILKADSVE